MLNQNFLLIQNDQQYHLLLKIEAYAIPETICLNFHIMFKNFFSFD